MVALLKDKLFVFVIAAVLFGGVLFVHLTFQIDSASKQVRESWEIKVEHYFERRRVYERFLDSFGYVGFIHHFKNALIRESETKAYQLEARTSWLLSQQNLLHMKDIFPPETHQWIDEVALVHEQYGEQLQFLEARSASSEPWRIAEIDRLVRVDDQRATEALLAIEGWLLNSEFVHSKEVYSAFSAQRIALLRLMSFIIPYSLFMLWVVFIYVGRTKWMNLEVKAFFESSPNAMVVVNQSGGLVMVNDAFRTLTGYSQSELAKMKIEDFVPINLRKGHKEKRQSLVSERILPMHLSSGYRGVMGVPREDKDFFLQDKQGSMIPVEIHLSSLYVYKQLRIIASIRNLSEKVALTHMAMADQLTGLPNRRAFEQRLQDEVARAIRHRRPLALIFIDLDHFKQINDDHGHDIGDEVLINVAKLLRARVRVNDLPGRLGGEEFLVLCPETHLSDAMILAESIREDIFRAEMPNGLQASASLGVAELDLSSGKYLDAKSLVNNADQAMYKAKLTGRNRVIAWVPPQSS